MSLKVVQLSKPNPMLLGPSQTFLPRPYKLCKDYWRLFHWKLILVKIISIFPAKNILKGLIPTAWYMATKGKQASEKWKVGAELQSSKERGRVWEPPCTLSYPRGAPEIQLGQIYNWNKVHTRRTEIPFCESWFHYKKSCCVSCFCKVFESYIECWFWSCSKALFKAV